MNKSKLSKYQEQKKTKPKIENMIDDNLYGQLKNDAIDFVNFLRANKMSPQWASTNSYALSYKNRRVCIIKINKEEWALWLNTQYNDEFNVCFASEQKDMQNILLSKLVYCFSCGKCAPGHNITILGKEIKNACYCPVIRLINPNEIELDCAKKLVLLRKAAIAENKAPKVMYVAKSKRK